MKYRHIWKYGYVDVTALSLFRAQPLGTGSVIISVRIIMGSDRRPETKQGIEGKIVRFRSGRVRLRDTG